jgi:hypothetical protein
MSSLSCPSCGVADCLAAFDRCLAADFSDAAYGAVHHLVVPAYGLQHGWYTGDVLRDVVKFVGEHLDRPPSDFERRRVRSTADGQVRVRARDHQPLSLVWDQTVADVDLATSTAYASSVRAWAASVASTIAATTQP